MHRQDNGAVGAREVQARYSIMHVELTDDCGSALGEQNNACLNIHVT